MSNIINEAIIDAKALREAALKNAEDSVINKYSDEVRKTLNTILEQDDFDLGLGDEEGAEASAPTTDDGFEDDIDNIPLAAQNDMSSLEGDNLKSSPKTGDLETFTLDLGALKEHVSRLREEIEVETEDGDEIVKEEEEPIEESEELYEFADDDSIEEGHGEDHDDDDAMEEEVDLDSLADAIMEKLTVDMGADLAGWAGRSSEDMKYQMEKEMAHRRTTEVAEEMETLKKAQEELVFENKRLTSELSKYKNAFGKLKESVEDINLSNARLLYTNRVLRNTSLNERQKNKIVEAISDAGSVNEARTIYNALQSTVQSVSTNGPQSLSEAINRPTSLLRATRKESSEPNDIFAERMKKLAGIK